MKPFVFVVIWECKFIPLCWMESVPTGFVPHYGQWHKNLKNLCPNPCRAICCGVIFVFSFPLCPLSCGVRELCVRSCLYGTKLKPLAQQKGSTLVETDEAKVFAVLLSCSTCLIQPRVLAEPISAVALDLLTGNHTPVGLKLCLGCSEGLRWALETWQLHLLLLTILVTVSRMKLQPLLWLNHCFWTWHLAQVVLEEQR